MPRHPPADASAPRVPARVTTQVPTRVPLRSRVLRILWPAFMAAGVLETLVFAVVDPDDLHGLGGAALGWSALSVYSVTFLMFWAAISTAGAVSELLAVED